jgi:hypothetical protein
MSNATLYDSDAAPSRSHYQADNMQRSTAVRDGALAVPRNARAEDLSVENHTETSLRNYRKGVASCPRALGGRIPQHPIFVPAGQKPTSSSSRR